MTKRCRRQKLLLLEQNRRSIAPTHLHCKVVMANGESSQLADRLTSMLVKQPAPFLSKVRLVDDVCSRMCVDVFLGAALQVERRLIVIRACRHGRCWRIRKTPLSCHGAREETRSSWRNPMPLHANCCRQSSNTTITRLSCVS